MIAFVNTLPQELIILSILSAGFFTPTLYVKAYSIFPLQMFFIHSVVYDTKLAISSLVNSKT